MSWNPPASQCQGKETFPTKGAALAVLDRIRNRSGGRRRRSKKKDHPPAGLHAYRCTCCHQFHLGNPNEARPDQ